MRAADGRVKPLIKRLEDLPYLLYTFLKVSDSYLFFISPHVVNYKIEKLDRFLPHQLTFFMIRNKNTGEILGYRMIPKNRKSVVFRKNYLLLKGADEKLLYNDYTGFPGVQCYFNADSLMLISNKVTDYYESIESVL